MDLHDKVAVVTGASRGLGRAFSAALVGAGARVFGLARSEGGLRDVQAALGDRFTPVECDVADRAAVEAAFAHVEAAAGRLDVLVNNAGLGRFAAVDALDPADWHVQVDTNLSGVFFCTRAAVPLMKRQHAAEGFGGHIVNVASVAGLIGNPNFAAYNATKFGVRGFSEAAMKELRPHGIKVTCVYPGSVDTRFFEEAGTPGNPHAMHPEDVAATVLHVLQTPPGYLISEVVMRPMKVGG
ncbi:MAG TPA: SDR family NAD(P)-dependent oxidoreductase [Rubricoccaceae bacterium]|jgi:NAD(P)-dependent dehydrogenase (short-subunit alcohol dehydrogenase family)|nr:SDR family NAD(P)-dependent oxidoreductase [Rubricoccaceae bacterium]